jgi:hypothetical protein
LDVDLNMMKTRMATVLLGGVGASCILLTGCTSSSGKDGAAAGNSSAAPATSSATSSSPGSSSASRSPSSSAAASSKARTHPRESSRTSSKVPPTSAPYSTPGRAPEQQPNQISVLNSLPGHASASCATVGTNSDIRSGSIAAGNFQEARKQYATDIKTTETPQLNLYVIPQNARGMRKLTVTVDPPGSGPNQTVTSNQVEEADQWRYFALVLPVRDPGAYQLSMTSGANHGCFDVTFSK